MSGLIVRFTVPGAPMGKQRPRVYRVGDKSRAVTPQKTVSYENLVKWCFSNTQEAKKLSGALRMDVIAYYSIPKSTSKKNRQDMIDGKMLHTKRGDVDNIFKIIADALNGIAYNDDGQIAEAYIKKMYSDNPRVEVTLREIT